MEGLTSQFGQLGRTPPCCGHLAWNSRSPPFVVRLYLQEVIHCAMNFQLLQPLYKGQVDGPYIDRLASSGIAKRMMPNNCPRIHFSVAIFYPPTNKPFMAALSLLFVLSMASLDTRLTGAQSIGVCLGGYGDNIPPVNETVNLYQSNNIRKMRIYDPDPTATLQALRGSKLELMLGVANENLQSLASSSTTATEWVQRNARDYLPDVKIRYIAVGNEVQPSDERLRFVLPAMQNIYNAISLAGLQNEIKVSTVIDLRLLGNYDRPSQASFSEAAMPNIQPIITFLVNIKSPLLANVYPYFTYIYNTETIQLPYALFTAPGVVVPDGELGYQNLFDALLDALYSAVEKVGGQSLEIVVAESGWPSDRGTYATVDSASTYYRNLINHVPRGTPKRSGRGIETYLFAMYDENLKPGDETERHFGLFYPDKQPKYQITFG